MMMMMMMIGIFTCVHPSRLPLTTNYLSEMFTLVTNGPSPFGKIVVPQTHTKMPGQRSFAVYCPVLWNRLLTSVRNLTVPEPFPSRTEDTVFSTELIIVIRCAHDCRRQFHSTFTRYFTVGERAFGVSASRVWNGLPSDVITSPSLIAFKRRLRTLLFSCCLISDSLDSCS